MASTWTNYHVFGPTAVMVGTGSSDALEYLGMTESGGRIGTQIFTKPKRSDASGDAPAVRIARGSICVVTVKMASWVESVLSKALRRSVAGAAVGQAGAIGSILEFAPGSAVGKPWAFGLAFPGTFDDPYYFAAAVLDNQQDVGISSADTELTLRFQCIKPVAGDALNANTQATFGSPLTSTADTVQLWQRTLPS